jgi:lauroyl/myristoyl acyltransferase
MSAWPTAAIVPSCGWCRTSWPSTSPAAAVLLFQKKKVVSIYQQQSNAVLDAVLRRNRVRLGDAEIFSRSEAGRALVRAIRRGDAFFNLPDMDFGTRDAAFVPFFGVRRRPCSRRRGWPRRST